MQRMTQDDQMLRQRLQSETEIHRSVNQELVTLQGSYRDLQASHMQLESDQQNLVAATVRLSDSLADVHANLREKDEMLANMN